MIILFFNVLLSFFILIHVTSSEYVTNVLLMKIFMKQAAVHYIFFPLDYHSISTYLYQFLHCPEIIYGISLLTQAHMLF